ncbi:taste receptor type 2 member 50-like [Sorex araneus]|uniref:taste receptor type 2 member 50-like n=1 Tax=Sorex araneus TaxID=42254 RepID=UPI002433C24C|nr:taste receptor type 2 member 50-like [Sorex araneus]
MITLLSSILTILVMAEFVLGNFANGFIVLVNYNDWVKTRTFSLADQMIVALAISRIGFLCVFLIAWYTVFLDESLYSLELFIIINMAWLVSYHASIWLATCLTIFYLLKIANFSNLLFLYLKRRVKRVVLIILMGSLVIFMSNLPLVIFDEKLRMNQYLGNRTLKSKREKIIHLSNMSVFTLTIFTAFVMSLTSFVLLIFSLWKHLRNMQADGKEDQDASTEVHFRAVKTKTSYLLLLACYFVPLLIRVWSSNRIRNRTILQVFQSSLGLYPSIHSFFLIWGNKKLQQSFHSFLCQLRLRLTERKRTLLASRRKQTDDSPTLPSSTAFSIRI